MSELKLLKVPILPDPFAINVWGTKKQLTKNLVSHCIAHGMFKSLPLLFDEDHTDVMLHAMRVAYFVVYRPQRDPLLVEEQLTELGDKYLWVMDGNHYLAACCFSGKTLVLCEYTKLMEKLDVQSSTEV